MTLKAYSKSQEQRRRFVRILDLKVISCPISHNASLRRIFRFSGELSSEARESSSLKFSIYFVPKFDFNTFEELPILHLTRHSLYMLHLLLRNSIRIDHRQSHNLNHHNLYSPYFPNHYNHCTFLYILYPQLYFLSIFLNSYVYVFSLSHHKNNRLEWLFKVLNHQYFLPQIIAFHQVQTTQRTYPGFVQLHEHMHRHRHMMPTAKSLFDIVSLIHQQLILL